MIPTDLQQALTAWLSQSKGSQRAGTRAMTATYRAGKNSSTIDLSAYLTARLPATYAAVSAVLGRLAQEYPEFTPQTLLDMGAGPGTASWAAAEQFDSLEKITLIDHDLRFLEISQELVKSSSHLPLSSATITQASLPKLAETALPPADLIIAAYSLTELTSSDFNQSLAQLWRLSAHALVLIEPGTPAGFARIMQARNTLIGQGAVIAAPCPHQLPCPLASGDWCHFKVRLARSRAHLHAKQAEVPFEDEAYSYLIAAKPETSLAQAVKARAAAAQLAARILAKPEETKFSRRFKFCAGGKLLQTSFESRNKSAYKRVSKDRWGDLTLLDRDHAKPEL